MISNFQDLIPKQTKDFITEETLKINAIEASNKKIESSIETLAGRQRAWLAKQKQDVEKLENGIVELEKLDIDAELDAHEQLTNWTELNNRLTSLNKEKATLEAALLRATKSVDKAEKDIKELDDAICYTCGQELHADKKKGIETFSPKFLVSESEGGKKPDLLSTDGSG